MKMCGRTSVERKRTMHIRKRTAGSDSSANKALGHSRLPEFHGRRRGGGQLCE